MLNFCLDHNPGLHSLQPTIQSTGHSFSPGWAVVLTLAGADGPASQCERLHHVPHLVEELGHGGHAREVTPVNDNT